MNRIDLAIVVGLAAIAIVVLLVTVLVKVTCFQGPKQEIKPIAKSNHQPSTQSCESSTSQFNEFTQTVEPKMENEIKVIQRIYEPNMVETIIPRFPSVVGMINQDGKVILNNNTAGSVLSSGSVLNFDNNDSELGGGNSALISTKSSSSMLEMTTTQL